jgi:hypothetical protein
MTLCSAYPQPRAFEQLVGAKSVEQAIEIQSQYAKKTYDTWPCGGESSVT